MKTYFFLSSAGGEDRAAVSRFHSDVENELRTLEGVRVGGLLNRRSVPTEEALSGAPASYLPAMVALCSDRYFADTRCIRDWDVFTERIANTSGGSETEMEGFIPLLWRPPEREFPAGVEKHLERVKDDFGIHYATLGLLPLLYEGIRSEYYRIVRSVAKRVAAAQHQGLPPYFGDGSPPATSAPAVGRAAALGSARKTSPAELLAASARKRIVLTFVGTDQEWADWFAWTARRDGHEVAQVRWNPTHGERISHVVGKVARMKPDVVVVLFSRRFRLPDLSERDGFSADDWDLLGDDGPFGDRLLRVVVDHGPMPAPLRDQATFDVSELDDHSIDLLLSAAGITLGDGDGRRGVSARSPGTPPEVWNSPVENEFFTGRDVELERIHELLSTRGLAVVVAHDGVPDLGVTEVAIEYSHRYKLTYDAVWWISNAQDVTSQLETFRERLSRAEHGQSTTRADPAAGRLVVFADVAEPAELRDVIARIDARVLVVADRVDDAWADRTVEIRPLHRADSTLLLREAAPTVDPDTAADIVAALGDRPGLVAETARYLLRGDISPRACADLLTMAARVRTEVADTEPVRSTAVRTRDSDARATPGGSGGVTDRDVNSLLGELVLVASLNDPAQFETWKSTLEILLGRSVEVPATWSLAARLLAVVEEAVAKPGPGMLDAVARALETVDSADRQVARFRRLVDQLGERWMTAGPTSQDGVHLSVELPRHAPAAPPSGPPRYLFFTSYARRSDRDHVLRFHEALQRELDLRLPQGSPRAGFLDLLSIEGGAHWRSELQHAVRTAPVMVALLSNDFFQSDWCGREFAVFAERARRATSAGGQPPAAIIPLNWLPLTESTPEGARDIQIANLYLGGGFDEMPLIDLMRVRKRVFRRFVAELAQRITSITRSPLPPLDERATEHLAPAFGGWR